MPQFRLTQKLAKDLKIKAELQPKEVFPVYDDWYVDLMRVNRKKIVVLMHVKTLIALAMPYYEIGGVKNIFKYFPISLRDFLCEIGFKKLAGQAHEYFNVLQENYTFTKTSNPSVLRYISQFKFHLEYDMLRYGSITQLMCNKVSKYWLQWLLKPKGCKDYTTPMEIINQVFTSNKSHVG